MKKSLRKRKVVGKSFTVIFIFQVICKKSSKNQFSFRLLPFNTYSFIQCWMLKEKKRVMIPLLDLSITYAFFEVFDAWFLWDLIWTFLLLPRWPMNYSIVEKLTNNLIFRRRKKERVQGNNCHVLCWLLLIQVSNLETWELSLFFYDFIF